MDDFTNFRQIGKGKDSLVYAATCAKLGGIGVVLKVYDKARISAIKGRSVRREARIMRFLTEARIPHVCGYIGAFQDSKQIYIVMEHCAGGDLLEQLLREGRAMTERRVVREVVLPVLVALAHLHSAGVIHRDIKLENLFISPQRGLTLGDFGLAVCVHEEKPISPVGTLEYMPPEILRLPTTDLVSNGTVRAEDVAPINEKVDLWSFGVTVYELVTGRSPFEGGSKEEIRANIMRHNMRPLPSFLTPDCSDWIRRAMTIDPAARPSATQLLRHRWVIKNLPHDEAAKVLDLRIPSVRMAPSTQAASSSSSSSPAAAPAPAPADAASAQPRAPRPNVERAAPSSSAAAAAPAAAEAVPAPEMAGARTAGGASAMAAAAPAAEAPAAAAEAEPCLAAQAEAAQTAANEQEGLEQDAAAGEAAAAAAPAADTESACGSLPTFGAAAGNSASAGSCASASTCEGGMAGSYTSGTSLTASSDGSTTSGASGAVAGASLGETTVSTAPQPAAVAAAALNVPKRDTAAAAAAEPTTPASPAATEEVGSPVVAAVVPVAATKGGKASKKKLFKLFFQSHSGVAARGDM